MSLRPKIVLTLIVFLFSACASPEPTTQGLPADTPTSASPEPTSPPETPTVVPSLSIPERMQRGVNLGNALEAPNEGEWGLTIQEEYFDLIQSAGFDFVRIPIRWSSHVDSSAPYTISPSFISRVDQVIEWALKRDLVVIINIHHYEPAIQTVVSNPERFLAIWRQIAQHYQGYPPELVFELFNEPDHTITAQQWNELVSIGVAAIRESNPSREIVIGGISWNAYDQLKFLQLPKDEHLIATFHYYLPFEFTHQGAEWAEGSNAWLGREWPASEAEEVQISAHFDEVAAWASENQLPILLGEFGAYSKADSESRARWTRFVRQQAEERGFAWAYWEFGAGFGVYDREQAQWNQFLKEALLP